MSDRRHRHAMPIFRRRLLHALVATGVGLALPWSAKVRAQPALLTPTPSQTEGPFYPRTLSADRDADLTRVAGRDATAQGTRLYFTGRVIARDGKPLAGATVELWQCDVFGRYHHAGDDGEPRDDNFQGYGVATTDAEGRYAFKTIRPVAYGGRPPHLHVKVANAGAPALTTQIYIKGDRVEGDPVLAWSPRGTLERLTMTLEPAGGKEPSAVAGMFEFVVK